jgi:hypothetical protein
MRSFATGTAACLLVAASAFGQDADRPSTRGALLYDAHCIACHTEQMHWREQRAATDWSSLKFQVRRWQGNAGLQWGDDDIDAVARFLNERFYRFGPVTVGLPHDRRREAGRAS